MPLLFLVTCLLWCLSVPLFSFVPVTWSGLDSQVRIPMYKRRIILNDICQVCAPSLFKIWFSTSMLCFCFLFLKRLCRSNPQIHTMRKYQRNWRRSWKRLRKVQPRRTLFLLGKPCPWAVKWMQKVRAWGAARFVAHYSKSQGMKMVGHGGNVTASGYKRDEGYKENHPPVVRYYGNEIILAYLAHMYVSLCVFYMCMQTLHIYIYFKCGK